MYLLKLYVYNDDIFTYEMLAEFVTMVSKFEY